MEVDIMELAGCCACMNSPQYPTFLLHDIPSSLQREWAEF